MPPKQKRRASEAAAPKAAAPKAAAAPTAATANPMATSKTAAQMPAMLLSMSTVSAERGGLLRGPASSGHRPRCGQQLCPDQPLHPGPGAASQHERHLCQPVDFCAAASQRQPCQPVDQC